MANKTRKTTVFNNIECVEYVNHSRIIELRLNLLFNRMEGFYGFEKTLKYFERLCDLFDIDPTKIVAIVNNYQKVMQLSRINPTRFNQEVIFMGALYGESRALVAPKYLGRSTRALYNRAEASVDNFVTEEWLAQLDNEVFLCSMPNYKNEAKRFVEAFETLSKLYQKDIVK